MSEVKPTESWNLPPSLVRHLNALCNRFEAAWQARQHPQIEEYLREIPETEQPAALRELLALELVYQLKTGDRPALDDYLARFPANGPIIREVFRQELPPAEQPLATGDAPPSRSPENAGEFDPPMRLVGHPPSFDG